MAIGHSVIFSSDEGVGSSEDASNRSASKSLSIPGDGTEAIEIFMSLITVLPKKDDEILAFWQMVYATDKKAIGIFFDFSIKTREIKYSPDTKQSMIEKTAHEVLYYNFEWWPDNWWEKLELKEAKDAYSEGYRYYPTLLQVRANIGHEIDLDGDKNKTQEKLSKKEGKLSCLLKHSTLLDDFVDKLDKTIAECRRYFEEIRELKDDKISPVLAAIPSPKGRIPTVSLYGSE